MWLLRQCLANKLRSRHWRAAHGAKKKWLESFEKHAVITGEPVEPPALVIIHHALPRHPDVDAPLKVVLDAVQEKMFTTHDDNAVRGLVVVPVRAQRGKVDPHIIVEAMPMGEGASVTRAWAAIADAMMGDA